MSNLYTSAYEQSMKDPDGFWGTVAEDCHWYKKWDKVLDDSNVPFYRWFTGGETNTCYNAVDLHVTNGMGNQTAIIYDSPVTDTLRKYSFADLKDEVSRFAGVLASKGVADQKEYKVPATIDDYSIFDEIKESLGKIGYGKKT